MCTPVARCRRPSIDGCLDAENDVARAIVNRRFIFGENAQAEDGHHRVIESARAGDVVAADGDVMKHGVCLRPSRFGKRCAGTAQTAGPRPNPRLADE